MTIYLLGYDLGLSDEEVIDVFPRVTERRTGRELQASQRADADAAPPRSLSESAFKG